MKVYHVSDEVTRSFTFEPRVPLNRMLKENKTAKRICVAASIENCLLGRTGIEPSDAHNFGNYLYHEIDPQKLSAEQRICFNRRRVYVADVDKNLVVKPRKVPDAPYTGEMWLTEPVTMVCEGEIVFSSPNTAYKDRPLTHDGIAANRYWWWSSYGEEYEETLRENIVSSIYCERHPHYKACRMPKRKCPDCWYLYQEVVNS